MKSNAVLILHDIRSAQNVGSLFRTADAAGISKIYLSPVCATPVDRFGRPVGAITKTALGAELTMKWEVYTDISSLIHSLQREGVHVIAIEQSDSAVDYKDVEVPERVAFMLGNEVEGIPPEILDLVDTVAEIPMQGTKESLNVSVAGGIALFRMLNL